MGQVVLRYGTVWSVVLLFITVSCASDESMKYNNQTETLIIGRSLNMKSNSKLGTPGLKTRQHRAQDSKHSRFKSQNTQKQDSEHSRVKNNTFDLDLDM